jgi:ribonuclease-3
MADRHRQRALPAAEIATRLDLEFRDVELLQRALTHPSWSAENDGAHYERLEFLGDSVLGFIVADMLHDMFPECAEGDLTRMKIALVRGDTLAQLALKLGLDDGIRLGRGAERSGDRTRPSVLEAAFEAVVGAIYLDSGVEGAREFVRAALGSRAEMRALAEEPVEPKTLLQEMTQAKGRGLPTYRIVHESGPPQDRTFTAEAFILGNRVGTGRGKTKQAAESAAAADAVRSLSSLG